MSARWISCLSSLAAVVLASTALVASVVPERGPQAPPPDNLEAILTRAGSRVAEFFTRAQSLVCLEEVNIQPLSYGLTGEGMGRTVVSELRLDWEPGDDGGGATEAKTKRQVMKVNGHPPRKNDRNSCTSPEQNETETQPLSMLLPEQRDDYEFTWAGRGTVDKRDALQVDFREREQISVDVHEIEGQEDCISYNVSGGMRGRLWIDAETFDVLRLDQRLKGLVEVTLPRNVARRPGATPIWTLERWDTTMRFRRVAFSEPTETLVLPVSTTVLRVTRGSGLPRSRTTTKFSNYRRFLTGGRIVGAELQ